MISTWSDQGKNCLSSGIVSAKWLTNPLKFREIQTSYMHKALCKSTTGKHLSGEVFYQTLAKEHLLLTLLKEF